tara:strand:- start:917 stop:2032 length:1116 start_codon:yes stop_codon:yes gene_type:complete
MISVSNLVEKEDASQILAKAISTGAMPGAVFLTGNSDEIIDERCLGNLTYAFDSPPTTSETIYDLASLTKIIVTTPLAMILYERGLLDLEAPVKKYIPEFSGKEKDDVLVIDLLAHCSGLLWWTDLYKLAIDESVTITKQRYIDHICELPLDYLPRSKSIYSDLGFLVLGEILERLTQSSLDQLFYDEIFNPLGMKDIQYRPSEVCHELIAPTEKDPWRNCLLQGLVHDENAFGLGGVAAHAGLFSTARAIAPLAQLFLQDGTLNGKRLFSPETSRLFTTQSNIVHNSSRALGWDTPDFGSSCGHFFSSKSYGHTGFTGTSLWLDKEKDFFVILLTNRVHPTRDNQKLASVRPAFHDAIMIANEKNLDPAR